MFYFNSLDLPGLRGKGVRSHSHALVHTSRSFRRAFCTPALSSFCFYIKVQKMHKVTKGLSTVYPYIDAVRGGHFRAPCRWSSYAAI